MYYQFQAMDYPFIDIIETLAEDKGQALKASFVDFKLNVYSNVVAGIPLAKIVRITGSASSITLSLAIKDSKSGVELGAANLAFNNSHGSEDFVRYHFDSSDFATVAPGYSFEGYFCFNQLNDLIAAFSEYTSGLTTLLKLEPATTAVFCNHRVDSIRCQTAKPLILQTTSSTHSYTDGGVGAVGDVKLIPGNNCTISIQKSTNTIIVGAQRNANDLVEEQCGVWSEKILPASGLSKDVLCNEVIYSISGVTPDDNGNVIVQALTPLICSSLTADEVQTYNSAFNGVLSQFSGIMRFVYVGLPRTANNPSVFNCDNP